MFSDPTIGEELFSTDPFSRFSPDGKYLAISAKDVVILDTATGKKMTVLPHPDWAELTENAYWSPDGKRIAALYSDPVKGDVAIIWDPFSRTQVSSMSGPVGSAFHPPVWSRDSQNIVAFGYKLGIDVLNVSNGKLSYTYPETVNDSFLSGWSSKDGFFAASTGYSAFIWSTATHAVLHNYKVEGQASWAPNSSHLAAPTFLSDNSLDRTLSVWDAATGQQITNYSYHDDQGQALAPSSITWSPNGLYIAAIYGDAVCVWKAPE